MKNRILSLFMVFALICALLPQITRPADAADAAVAVTTASKPTITTQPKSVTVALGATATFKVVASGSGLKYQWQYKKVGATSWTSWSGKTAATLTVTASSTNGGCQYRCVVSNTAGSVTSSAATLTVTGGAAAAPTISKQPASKLVREGASVSFSVTASGSGLSYQWQVSKDGGTLWKNCSSTGYNQPTFTFKPSAQFNKWMYRCVVKNSAGSVTSSKATLTVTSTPTTKPKISTQPGAVSAENGKYVTFSVVAAGGGLGYQWQVSKDGGTTWKDCSSVGYNHSMFSFKTQAGFNSWLYRCVVTSPKGTVTSSAAKLTVTSTATAVPTITKQPAAQSVARGQYGSFSVTAAGGGLSYQWQVSKDGGSTWKDCSSTGNNRSTFSFKMAAAYNGWMYRCKVSNSKGSVYSSKAKLTLKAYQGFVSKLQGGKYVRADDEEIYDLNLGRFAELAAAANAEVNPNKRFVLFAQAEAELLDSAVMAPYSTQGGSYALSRIAPHTVPFVRWGNDDDRIGRMVVTADSFLTRQERADLLAQWRAAVFGNGTYDPAAYLKSKGHSLKTSYTTTFSSLPITLDWLNTSSQSDTEAIINCVDGLVEYDNLGNLQPRLAKSWEVSADGLTYTFHLRTANWYTSTGAVYAPVTAGDFVAGFRHMLDAAAGLEWLACEGEANIAGTDDYLWDGGSFANVGYKALDDHTLRITLTRPTPYFLTMLTYSCFLPICDSFYRARGGVYGIEEYCNACGKDSYTFGKTNDVTSQVYCGPFILQKMQLGETQEREIKLVKNTKYYGASSITLNAVKWVYDEGEDPAGFYEDACSGVYASVGLSQASGTLDLAKDDGNFDKYAYVTDTTSTTYFAGLNLDRGAFALDSGACASPKTQKQRADTVTAMNNRNFRKAMQFGWDRAAMNAVSRGEDLAAATIRNMYTAPDLVKLSAAVTDAKGYTFPAGTLYGDMVQYYLNRLGSPIQVADQQDGWYNPTAAKAALQAAKEELGSTVSWPIRIDVVYYEPFELQTAQAEAYKSSIEQSLGKANVVVNLIAAYTAGDFYACGYSARNGAAGNFDMFYGSGWGPDYGDPSAYLNTFLSRGAGYMTKVIGLF